jgi:hypothetical protein
MCAIAVPARSHGVATLLTRSLDPVDALVEGIFSVLIVLTFTLAARGTGEGATSGRL